MSPAFGRIPPETVALLEANTQAVRTLVGRALPTSASEGIRAFTIETLLDAIMRDWSENDNVAGLLPQDGADLESFVRAAAAMAGTELTGSAKPVYHAVLKGLVEDWLANWNANGHSGPPTR